MSTNITKIVTITGKASDGAEVTSEGCIHIIEYDHNDRVKRAAKAWLISWGLAIASIPLIIAHWVLIPGFLIAGPFMARRYFRTESTPQRVSGICPVCGEESDIKLESSDKLPLWTYCTPKRNPVHITLAGDS